MLARIRAGLMAMATRPLAPEPALEPKSALAREPAPTISAPLAAPGARAKSSFQVESSIDAEPEAPELMSPECLTATNAAAERASGPTSSDDEAWLSVRQCNGIGDEGAIGTM
jgi:hypothetical protein